MKKRDVQVRAATIEDYVQFFGKYPERTIMGYTVWLDGEMVAIFGTIPHKNGVDMLFSDMKAVDVPKMTIYRWSKRLLSMGVKAGKTVYATSQSSGKFLSSLGFRFCGDTKYGRLYEYIG